MGLFDQFPYTNFHELNLDWLMQAMKNLESVYKGLKDEIQQTIDFVNNFEEHADELIDDRIVIAMAHYQQKLIAVETLVKQLEAEINKDDGLSGQIAQLRTDLEQTRRDLEYAIHECNDRYHTLLELMHEYKHSMDGVVESATVRLEAYIKDTVTRLDRLDVTNPITGVFENIQNVLNDLAEIVSRGYALTAQQYDDLKLTAHVYDSFRITAYDYSTKGYFELYLKLKQNLMRSPFTGNLDKYDTVIYELANLHKCALTAQEYDDRQITAQEYDKFLLTAWEYDWFGFKIAQTITAKRYDDLMLTAESYDNKRVTAEQYEHGMKFLVDTTIRGVCDNCGDYMILATQISRLTDLINEYTKKVDDIEGGSTRNENSYVGLLSAGQTVSEVDAQSLDAKSYVAVLSEVLGVQPKSIVTTPADKKVTTTWDRRDKDMYYSVVVQNNQN